LYVDPSIAHLCLGHQGLPHDGAILFFPACRSFHAAHHWSLRSAWACCRPQTRLSPEFHGSRALLLLEARISSSLHVLLVARCDLNLFDRATHRWPCIAASEANSRGPDPSFIILEDLVPQRHVISPVSKHMHLLCLFRFILCSHVMAR
jgi:hypothetical protein